MAYWDDLGSRLLRAVEKGRSARSQAEVFEVAPSTAVPWVAASRHVGRPGPKPHRGGRWSPLDAHADWLKAGVAEKSETALSELRAALAARAVATRLYGVSRFFERIGYSFKNVWRKSRNAPTWRRRARPGGWSSRFSIREISSSSMKPVAPPALRARAAVVRAASV